ncbi:hypothetical protein NVP1170O_175 [Vibrio phage 1.170.O._10N.261.52.C3]|nr:hypothetical protein NVP1170O_175 [Vibrio phage 1.170.O._10N.261.52.C3]
MIEKMKRTPKAKHGYKVWIRDRTILEVVNILGKVLDSEEVSYSCDVQYGKPSILLYTDSEEWANYIDKLIGSEV